MPLASPSDPNAPASPPVELRQTADGSYTLYRPDLREHYHSVHGARQESAHVFIQHGLWPVLQSGVTAYQAALHVLEVGLGTGLNAALTALEVGPNYTEYDALEPHPVPDELLQTLLYQHLVPGTQQLDAVGYVLERLHALPWDAPYFSGPLSGDLRLRKHRQTLEAAALTPNWYHLIYFDAFAPEKQPELWTAEIFAKLYAAARPGGVLVTYCAQGQFRRALRAAGWQVEKLPGPPGKREMTRAVKKDK